MKNSNTSGLLAMLTLMFTDDITSIETMWARSNNSESYASLVFSLNDQNFSVAKTKPLCTKVPDGLEEQIQGMTDSIALSAGSGTMVSCPYLRHLNSLIDALDQLLLREGLITESGELVHFKG